MERLYQFLVVIVIGKVHGEDVGPAACHLPSGAAAACVPITECGPVLGLLANLQKPLPTDVSLLIRESYFCGSRGGQVAVCCPRETSVTSAAND